ncbi:MAG TPA: hypothetical protein VJ884_01355 [Salinibacter sp.]|nr:hypothetical protein [Salinibacter sp.]
MSGSSSRAALLSFATLLTSIVLFACGGSKETTGSDVVTDTTQGPVPSLSDTRQALNEALETFNNYCLAPTAQSAEGKYPLELYNPSSNAPSFKYRELWALTQVGLLDTTIVRGARGLPTHRFGLTEAGRSAQYDIAQGRTYKAMFCFGVPRVVRLDSIKAVYNAGPNPLARVWFAYNYQDVGDWGNARAVRRAFSALPPLPSPTDTLHTKQLLVRVDSAWIDRRLTGFDRPPERPGS